MCPPPMPCESGRSVIVTVCESEREGEREGGREFRDFPRKSATPAIVAKSRGRGGDPPLREGGWAISQKIFG